MNKDSIPDLSGKCVSIRIEGSDYSHDLCDPHFEYQGGRLFIVGYIPVGSSESGWDNNQIGAIDWARVRNYVLFNNLEEYTKAIKISESYEPEKDEK